MGAYSSWAMLAITHHTIVRYSALRVGVKNFTDYAILGDDIVIRNSRVAESYRIIMDILGVTINPSKSLISKDFAEFAKMWKGKDINLSPLGPGLILRSVRYKYYQSVLLSDSVRTGLILSLPKLLSIISRFEKPVLCLWTLFGVGSSFWKKHSDACAILWNVSTIDPNDNLRALRDVLLDNCKSVQTKEKDLLLKEKESHISEWFSWTLFPFRSPWRLLECLFKIIGPSRKAYMLSFYNSELELKERNLDTPGLYAFSESQLDQAMTDTDLSVFMDHVISRDSSLTFSKLDWNSKDSVKKFGSKTSQLAESYHNRTAFYKDLRLNPPKDWWKDFD
jgi:hypothetical protein